MFLSGAPFYGEYLQHLKDERFVFLTVRSTFWFSSSSSQMSASRTLLRRHGGETSC